MRAIVDGDRQREKRYVWFFDVEEGARATQHSFSKARTNLIKQSKREKSGNVKSEKRLSVEEGKRTRVKELDINPISSKRRGKQH